MANRYVPKMPRRLISASADLWDSVDTMRKKGTKKEISVSEVVRRALIAYTK